jgi:hypothetical protein
MHLHDHAKVVANAQQTFVAIRIMANASICIQRCGRRAIDQMRDAITAPRTLWNIGAVEYQLSVIIVNRGDGNHKVGIGRGGN